MKNYAAIADLKAKAIFHIEKAFDRGYDQGYNDCKVELLEDEAKCHYQEGYNDGYRKGVERGKEARVTEADCAYQCGMRKAWDLGKKIFNMPCKTAEQLFHTAYYPEIFLKFSVSEVMEKIKTYEEKQDAPEMNVESIENRDKIVKAIAGLLAAYGEQLWDVAADMQKNP